MSIHRVSYGCETASSCSTCHSVIRRRCHIFRFVIKPASVFCRMYVNVEVLLMQDDAEKTVAFCILVYIATSVFSIMNRVSLHLKRMHKIIRIGRHTCFHIP
jgi:hypothetical protein